MHAPFFILWLLRSDTACCLQSLHYLTPSLWLPQRLSLSIFPFGRPFLRAFSTKFIFSLSFPDSRPVVVLCIFQLVRTGAILHAVASSSAMCWALQLPRDFLLPCIHSLYCLCLSFYLKFLELFFNREK
jgi:hypothetical protein